MQIKTNLLNNNLITKQTFPCTGVVTEGNEEGKHRKICNGTDSDQVDLKEGKDG